MAINLGDNERETAWRQEVRSFIQAEAPAIFGKDGEEEVENALFGRLGAVKAWRDKVAERGWVAPAWPKAYGGAEMSVVDQFIINEEFSEAGVPANVGGFGVMMLGPTLIEHGTEEQKAEHLGG